MGVEYSIQAIRELEDFFYRQKILRPRHSQRYDPGTELNYEVTGVVPAHKGSVLLQIERFIGGGYAGQVYRAKALKVEAYNNPIQGLHAGNVYAIKILIPPSGFARIFRNFVYALAFQGPFAPQSNLKAARAGALWQKLIRQAASLRLGSEKAIVDIFATFVDPALGSCGEISEWIEGRMWRFEVDDNLDARLKRKTAKHYESLGSPEYRAKRVFMDRLVSLMHDMGALELARQYEWWTCKSQPNALKRLESDPNPQEGLVAVDFRAGLALLPFLPMCPVDFRLILQGIAHGSLVQFDRGNTDKLQSFIQEHRESFAGWHEAVEELKEAEKSYRDSLPDITHNGFRLIYSPKLRSSIMQSNIKSWKIRNIIDQNTLKRLQSRRFLAIMFWLLGVIPFLGKFLRKLWGRGDYRRHMGQLITNLGYFRRSTRARIAESLIRWHRVGRVNQNRALKLTSHPARFYAHLPLSLLPAKMHRFLSDGSFLKEAMDYIFVRPIRLYFKAEARERWLQQLIIEGQEAGMLSENEAVQIKSQIKEPFIQKYLKSLAVHVCTVPVTQIVSVIVAIIYVRLHPELSWQEASLHAGLILGLFQVIPISPGSLVRGLYVTFLVWRERSFKNYNIAFYLSFFKYIGYLAFPIQMAYRYPDLARFMAGHWATGAVHIVPVFGERGALLEHIIFDAFYNYPLNVRRRISQRSRIRASSKPRSWHTPLVILAGTGLLTLLDIVYFHFNGQLPQLGDIWWIALWIPAIAAAIVTAWAGSTPLSKRTILASLCGMSIGLLYTISNMILGSSLIPGGDKIFSILQFMGRMGTAALWKMFLFTIIAFMGVIVTETRRVKARSTVGSD